MAPPPSRASGPYRPTRLGQWNVVAKIAGGGMSAVYLGRRFDPDPDLPNVVALKIVRHDVAKDDRLVQMFLEEGKLLARLVHPNIVRTLEVGGDAEQDFIAMELMLGKTLAAIQDALAPRGLRLAAEIVAWVAARIADALHYAHELTDERGRPLALVHRDVNPANVFATFGGEVKLFDFGLAKETAGESSGSQLLAGKLSYLSPEQIMQMPLDRRSDIFSLGTTLWELLTSRRLFRRDTDVDTVRAVQLGPIPDPRTVAPEVPDDLARIAKTALERNRDHRYPSAAHLARELDAFVLARTSRDDITARIAELVDTLFPGEHKRQSGWLKPAITSSITRAPGAVTTTPRPGAVARPMPPEVRRDTLETTIVMANAAPVPPSSRASTTAATVPDGIPAVPVSPSTPRGAAPSAFTPAPTARDGVRAVRPPPAITAREGVPAAPPPVPGASRPVASPPRARPPHPVIPTPPPFSRTDIQAIPPAPDSRTEISPLAPTIEQPVVRRPPAPTASVPSKAPDRERTPSAQPGPLPGTIGGRPRPTRPPVPLPSRARAQTDSVVPPARTDTSRKAAVEKAPDSERTQIDMPVPPGGRRP